MQWAAAHQWLESAPHRHDLSLVKNAFRAAVGAHDILFQQKEVLHLVQQDEGRAAAGESVYKVAEVSINSAVRTRPFLKVRDFCDSFFCSKHDEVVEQRAQEARRPISSVEARGVHVPHARLCRSTDAKHLILAQQCRDDLGEKQRLARLGRAAQEKGKRGIVAVTVEADVTLTQLADPSL